MCFNILLFFLCLMLHLFTLFFDLIVPWLFPFIYKVRILRFIFTFLSAITPVKGLDRTESYQYLKSAFTCPNQSFHIKLMASRRTVEKVIYHICMSEFRKAKERVLVGIKIQNLEVIKYREMSLKWGPWYKGKYLRRGVCLSNEERTERGPTFSVSFQKKKEKPKLSTVSFLFCKKQYEEVAEIWS